MDLFTSLLHTVISVVLYTVAPLVVYTKYQKDLCILVFGFLSVFTMNTTPMALVRDLGGTEWLEEMGNRPWFRYQYTFSYWCLLMASVFLILFLFRLRIRRSSTFAKAMVDK